jgi:hypothetical protein
MNCLEFRRGLGVEPARRDAEWLAHRDGCARCRDAYERAQHFESSLRGALAVPVPDGLADRVLLRQTTTVRGERGAQRRSMAWRVAAALALAVGVAALYGISRPVYALPELAVAHLTHEPMALTAHGHLDAAQVAAVFHASGVPLHAEPGPVDYLALCSLARDDALHVVVQRPEGPVTVFFVVGRHDGARTAWTHDGMKGRTIPLRDGTLVLLARDDASFDALERAWTAALAPT